MSTIIRRTTTLADADFTQALRSETHAPVEGGEGFGCPWSSKTCHNHCKSVGYRGGYCKGKLNQTCKCYG